ncbi:hypothetical protein HY621_02955 [Candidatus Uhrbacteria bacterium]|nr:hypothetical protein [Candidatus Uhrbacteria bacterium]
MKRILSVAVATTMLVAAPALAATPPTPSPAKPAATQAPVTETFNVQFRKIEIAKATTVYPGDKATLIATVKGVAKTLRFDAYIGDVKLPWSRKFANVTGEVIAKFLVPSDLATGNLRFEVLGVSRSGQESSDEDIFLSAGPTLATPAATPAPAPVATPAARRTDALTASPAPTATPAATKGATMEMPKFEYGVTHNSRPIASASQSNNFTTSQFRLGFGNGMLVGLKALSAPEDSNANPGGQIGYVPFAGWQGAATKDVQVELTLGAHLPVAGATSSHPLELEISFCGNPGWEQLSHRLSLHTDLSAPSIEYSNALRVAGDMKGLQLRAISGTSHVLEGGYRPQLWLGAELAGPLSGLGGANAALGVAYDVPIPTSGASWGDGVRLNFSLSQF